MQAAAVRVAAQPGIAPGLLVAQRRERRRGAAQVDDDESLDVVANRLRLRDLLAGLDRVEEVRAHELEELGVLEHALAPELAPEVVARRFLARNARYS